MKTYDIWERLEWEVELRTTLIENGIVWWDLK